MPWLKFTEPFDWKPTPQVTQAFRAGDVKLVTTACAKRAVALGRAVKTGKPKGGGDGK